MAADAQSIPRGGRRNILNPVTRQAIAQEPAAPATEPAVEEGIETTHLLMRAPENCAPVTIEGVEYEPDEAGDVFIAAEHVERVRPFGFKAV